MKIGLIDVDGHNYPNLPLMKISAWHKAQGDSVEWYQPLFSGHMDKVYMSKVFSFTPDYEYYVDADVIEKGGSGYCIELVDGKEVFHKDRDKNLPDEIEHIYPDYSLYPKYTKDTAYGFLTRGCPRGCEFCHVEAKEGKCSYKVEFNQGLDIRLINDRNLELLKQIRLTNIHFAFDRWQDREIIEPRLRQFSEIGYNRSKGKVMVYILVNFDTTIEQDLYRIQLCRELNFSPYPMIYDKEHADAIYRKIQRWCNNIIFWSVPTFEQYQKEII